MEDQSMDRRALLRGAVAGASAASVTWAASGCAQTTGAAPQGPAVIYLSRSGNTRVLAGAIARHFDAPAFEVRPRDPWPADYEEMVSWASEWRGREAPMPLAEKFDLTGFQTIFVGFPVWGMALPAPMRAALTQHSFAGKTVRPFITHGGYGPGSIMDGVKNILRGAQVADPFVIQCDQERDTLNKLGPWMMQQD